MKHRLTIQIPVCRETDAIRFSKHYFDHVGIPVRYVMDRQRTAETEAVIDELGIPRVFYENDKPYIENGYQSFAEASPTDWILRLDCDELPSPELLKACRKVVENNPDEVFGIVRHQLIRKESRFVASTHERFLPEKHTQFRLFNRKKVTFTRRIHTPGFELNGATSVLPKDACLYHLSWVFLSWKERLEKSARYDAHGQPEYNRGNQLFPIESSEWRELNAPQLERAYAEWCRIQNGEPPSSGLKRGVSRLLNRLSLAR